jgi:hypothetical protein
MAQGEALMAKSSEDDRITELECEVGDLKRRLALVEALVDSRQEKLGVTATKFAPHGTGN